MRHVKYFILAVAFIFFGCATSGTLQIKITGISGSIINNLSNYEFACWLDLGEADLPVAGFLSSPLLDFEIGGTGNDCWISFYIYGITLLPADYVSYYVNTEKYTGTTKNYDITISAYDFDKNDFLFYVSKAKVRLEVNKLNILDYNSF